MDQVSRPLLIALGAMVVFLAVWLVALKPKPVAVTSTPLAPTNAVPLAKQAAATSDAANAKLNAAANAAGGTATTATPAAAVVNPAKPAASPTSSKLSVDAAAKAGRRGDAAVLRDIRAKKVVVMLFWSPKGSDDIATRRVIRGLDRRNGKVAVHVAPIGRVGQYDSITRGVRIIQSPTTIVIDRKHRTRVITGLTESQELGQAVGDALAGR
jgi:hypothetical protein